MSGLIRGILSLMAHLLGPLLAGFVHVLNRGNGQRQVVQKDDDCQAFLKAIGHACIEIPVPVLAYCLMSIFFHLVVRPNQERRPQPMDALGSESPCSPLSPTLSKQRPLWQGRLEHFHRHRRTLVDGVALCRTKSGACQIGSASGAMAWSSACYWQRTEGRPRFLEASPVERPADWLDWVQKSGRDGPVRDLEAKRKDEITPTQNLRSYLTDASSNSNQSATLGSSHALARSLAHISTSSFAHTKSRSLVVRSNKWISLADWT